ncbi:ankyrin protein [Fusarium subglutinans]|uniref:Ankyrin protein n=1 Tax=Gibberella subglutinans TaxID=42677 RepID=A0A8H5Q4H1_GIBSU|nr:ankyrin protein [Fusarium subglutinans]KAF5607388.1 ankyrin protein [Fusarium subglutinans]
MPQAPRIPPAVWEAQKPRITELYINQDKTLDEVIQIMAESGFHATKPQYIRKVNVNWKLQKNYTKEKWQHASALVKKRQAEGKLTELRIDGQVISEKRRKKELRRYHVSQVEEEFAATNTSGVVACTPPSFNSRVVLINGLPWLKFQESFSNLIKSQRLPFNPNQQNGSPGFWEAANKLLSGAHNTGQMATGSLPLPPRPVSGDLLKHVDIKGQRLFELVPMLDNSMEILPHQEPPWLQIFNSLVFLCSNNLMEIGSSAYELLQVAISSGFLIKVKHLFTTSSPTLEIFAIHLLFATLGVEGSKGMEVLRFLLESGISPDSTDPSKYGCSALHTAVREDHLDAVQLLLRSGADPNGKVEGTEDITLDTPLNYALDWNADTEIAKMLIESGADVNLGSEKPLLQAVTRRQGDLVLVKHMLEAGADPKMLPAKGLSAIYSAIIDQELSLINTLIEAGVSLNLMVDELDDEDIEFVEYEFRLHYNATSILTPLGYAVFIGNAGIVKRLIEGGAVLDIFIDPEILEQMEGTLSSDQILTPLQLSVQESQHEITKILLDAGAGAGAGVDFRHPATGTTLQLVCSSSMEEREKIELTKVLLAKGADINSLPGEHAGRTAMQAAAESGHHDLLKLLLTRGGNLFASAAKENGLTVFQAALRSRSVELVTYVFWELGSSCTCFNFFDGTNYLEEAVSTGDLQLLETVMKFWNHHELHWPREFISSALRTAIRHDFTHFIHVLDAGSFTIPKEAASSMICESIWNGDESTFDWLIERFAGAELDLAQPGYPTPLWLAMHQGKRYMAQSLLNAGANPNKPSLVVCRNSCCHDIGSEMPLKPAICQSDNDLIELLIDKGAKIHCFIDGDLTPLLFSLRSKNEDAAVFLLSRGADPNVVDISGRYTALGFALDRVASLSTVQTLIQRGADVNRPSVWGTALEQAAKEDFGQHDTLERCQLLLAAGANVNAYTQSTALKSAVARGDEELAELFIEAGANVNASKIGVTALQLAVQNNNTNLAKMLVKAGADANTFSNGTGALGLAVRNNNLELAILLLAEGADVNALAMGNTLLQEAARLGSFEMVKHLIDRGADVDAKVPLSTATALQYASMGGSVEIVKYLIEHGASVDEEASPFYEATALELAINRGHTDVAIYLIEKGAPIDERSTTNGKTPLQLAAKHKYHEILTYLVEKGAAVNAAPATERGATALQFAAINGNIKMAIFLLENGAHVNAKGAEVHGRTALQGAAEHGRLDMIHLLLDNDVEPDTIEERCCNAAEFAEVEHHDLIARILRNYKKP